MHGGCTASELWHIHPNRTPVAIVFGTLTESPLLDPLLKVERSLQAIHFPDSRPSALNNQTCYSVPKPKRLIWLAMAVPTDTKPNIRSNGCVYLNTIEVNRWYGSSQ